MRHRISTVLAVPLLAGLLVLTGCGGGSDDAGGSGAADASLTAPRQEGGADERSDAGADGDEAPAAAGEPEEAAENDAGGESADAATARQGTTLQLPSLHLVRTARLTVLIDDVPDAYGEAVRLVERADGYVSAEETYQYQYEEEGRHSRLTVRVPPENYSGLLHDLAALGKLQDREVSTADVTSEVVDVESRIATQEESVARVRALMAEATSITDVVQLERELTTRQADLESLKAQQKSLSERTGMATITLDLEEKARKKAKDQVEDKDDGPSIGGALSGGWNAFIAMLVWAGVVVSAALPFLVATALLVLVLRWLARRRRFQAPPPPSVPPAAAHPAPVTEP